MTEIMPAERNQAPLLSRRDMLTAALAGAVLGSVPAVDVLSRPPADSAHPTLDFKERIRGTKLLFAFHPGLFAQVEKQASSLISEAREVGDVASFDYGGPRYDEHRFAEFTAQKMAELMKKGNYDDVIFNAISMGGIAVYHALTMLADNRTDEEYSTRMHLTGIDAITSRHDLVGIRKVLSLLSRPMIGGGLEKGLPLINGGDIPLTRARDEIAAIAGEGIPAKDSLSVASLVLWQSTQDTELVDAEAAANHWLDAASLDTPHLRLRVDLGHAAIESDPELAVRAFKGATLWHLKQNPVLVT